MLLRQRRPVEVAGEEVPGIDSAAQLTAQGTADACREAGRGRIETVFDMGDAGARDLRGPCQLFLGQSCRFAPFPKLHTRYSFILMRYLLFMHGYSCIVDSLTKHS